MEKAIKFLAYGLIGFSMLSTFYVALMGIVSPQAVMDLVQVELGNNDAISSIRGVYGGVGIVVVTILIYALRKNLYHGLVFLSLFWGSYVFSRILTFLVDGQLGDFGNQWLIIETMMFLLNLTTLILFRKSKARQVQAA